MGQGTYYRHGSEANTSSSNVQGVFGRFFFQRYRANTLTLLLFFARR